MTSLNLPPFDVRLKGTKQAPLIFDFLRRRYVRLTPEEWVRQHFVHFMVEHRHYPAVFDQIVTYNMLLHVDYLVVSNGLQHYVCKMDYDGKKYLYLEELPDYSNIFTE